MTASPARRIAVHLAGSEGPRPASSRTAYCDGAADGSFRSGIDVELSHWVPNRTPARYRADTSTEICLRFAADEGARPVDLVVNNHVDVDGVLSVYAASRPDEALPHAGVLIGAAEAGDFWAWTEPASFALYEGLAVLQARLEAAGADAARIYQACFERIPELLLDSADADPDVSPGLLALGRAWEAVENRSVDVRLRTPRLVHFVAHRGALGTDPAAAFEPPGFNAPLARSGPLVPHARDRVAHGLLQILSIADGARWRHELWLPGYAWADVVRRELPAGLVTQADGSRRIEMPRLIEAVRELGAQERGQGRWQAADRISAFDGVPGRGFPVVAACLDASGALAPSTLDPDVVGAAFAAAFPG